MNELTSINIKAETAEAALDAAERIRGFVRKKLNVR